MDLARKELVIIEGERMETMNVMFIFISISNIVLYNIHLNFYNLDMEIKVKKFNYPHRIYN